jgi:3-deoxy-D-manno-octulosonic-acid transferase
LTALLQKNNLEFVLYSNQSQYSNAPILVVNTIGILSKIYNYATLAYIGGGLNDGIHNCLEPAVYHKPVLFYGNDYHKFNEAVDLIKLNAAKNILSAKSLEFEISQFIDNKSRLAEIESILRVYFQKKSGTTKQILSKLNLN